MANEIISYIEMCAREGASLQRGMNFQLGRNHSVILMSIRPGAPYRDRVEENGSVLIYEGHDEPRSKEGGDPKLLDQPEFTPGGTLTQNGLFQQAARAASAGRRPAERVRVYEKLKKGIWSYNGVFHLLGSNLESDGTRQVFMFKLVAVDDEEPDQDRGGVPAKRRRIIPTPVKVEVWQRDAGKCVKCGSADELHFDHIVPFSRGGTSLTADNVQLLCARHNIQKRDRIV